MMKELFFDYYTSYLGTNIIYKCDNIAVVKNAQREVPLCNWYYYHLICTEQNDNFVFSISPKYSDKIINYFDGIRINTLDDVKPIITAFSHEISNDVSIKKLLKMSIPVKEMPVNKNITVEVLTTDLLRSLTSNLSKEDLESLIQRKKDELDNGRQHVIIDKGKIVSWSKISDIDYNGANIAVWTSPEYRKLGYGKEVVLHAINWCHMKKHIPIYYVDVENIASVTLAKKIGFEILSKEYALVSEIR